MLRALDIDRLHIAVKLLPRALLVVTLPADAHAQSVWYAFHTAFPDFLVQLRI